MGATRSDGGHAGAVRPRAGRAARRSIAALVLVLAALATSGPPRVQAAPDGAADAGQVPASIADRYLAHQPSLGPVTVIDIEGESGERKLLAATLQGIVNRTEARIYLLGARPKADDQYWLDWYRTQGLITVVATVGLDAAVSTFAGEAHGYVVASYDEPWTINTATSVAGAEGALVARAGTITLLESQGLSEIADHRGAWPDAVSAYRSVAEQYRDSLDYGGVALQQPGLSNPRDLFVQQGVLTMFTRPSQGDFDAVYDLIDTFPTDHPVYGYVSDTSEEEVAAVARLALAGRFLVPTDTTTNLSFHIAVGGSQRATAPRLDHEVEPCTSDDVNVVLALSDGDNMVIPEAYFPRSNAWGSPRRGELPIGWGISPATAVLMPAVWDHYAATASDNDELVDIMGLGYTFPSVMPNGTRFLADGSTLRATVAMSTHWGLDPLIRTPEAGGWDMWHDAIEVSGTKPGGMLLNYIDWGGPAWFYSPDDVPVLSSQETQYAAGPDQVLDELTTLLAADPDERPLVNLFAITVWSTSYDELVDTVGPLEGQGVRFLTPSEAFACLPAPSPDPPASTPVDSTTTAPGGTPSTEAPAARPVSGAAAYVG